MKVCALYRALSFQLLHTLTLIINKHSASLFPQRHSSHTHQVIDCDLLDYALRVYDEQTPQRNTSLLQQHTIARSNGLQGLWWCFD